MYTWIMKKRELERMLRSLGWYPLRQGKHEVWTNGKATEPVPRHTEIDDYLARKIIRRAAANPPEKD